MDKTIQDNARIHDNISHEYDYIHREIFNPIEQGRLYANLKETIALINTDTPVKLALDYGCGSGNLTNHLLKLGLQVFSADVSDKFLRMVKAKFAGTNRCTALKINGYDLSSIKDNFFDFCATYSVLHHVPDYLAIIRELVRVTKPDGVIYIDHEKSESSWKENPDYEEFSRQVKRRTKFKFALTLRKYSKPANYIYRIRRLFNPRYAVEGDIHVWPDDHIEWHKIIKLMHTLNCTILFRKDYLLYTNYPVDIYEAFKNKCSDYSVMAVIKK